MKAIIVRRTICRVVLGLILMAMGKAANAQPCIPCNQETFPYGFCPNPESNVQCSSNPNAGSSTPFKAFIPGCVQIAGTFPALVVSQPDASSPELGRDHGPPGDEPFNPGDTGDAPNPDDHAGGDTDPQYLQDYSDWEDAEDAYKAYLTADADWQEKNTEYNAWLSECSDVHLTTVWDQSQASTDASNALNAWLSLCPALLSQSQENASCCLAVTLDDNVIDWQILINGQSPDYSSSNRSFALAYTDPPTASTPCPETICSQRGIELNTCPKFIFESNDPNPQPDPNWGVPVADRSWFTGQSAPNVSSTMQDFSFNQAMEHEIGHYFGLHHPTDNASSGGKCSNNLVTPCTPPKNSVMNQNQNVPNQSPMQLTFEDKVMFQDLYSPLSSASLSSLGVNDGEAASRDFTSELYPNPSKGSLMLKYTLTEPCSVSISISDILGSPIIVESLGTKTPNTYFRSLDLKQLPSGKYICRVRAGSVVSYQNFIIER